MGALILPPSGSIYLDANPAIYAVEKIEPYASFLAPLWPAAQAGQVSLVTSELTWLETLFRAFLTAQELELVPVTLSVWEDAARLRALGLKTPDAVHAAPGLAIGCAVFLTNDAAFSRVPGLPVIILSAAIAI